MASIWLTRRSLALSISIIASPVQAKRKKTYSAACILLLLNHRSYENKSEHCAKTSEFSKSYPAGIIFNDNPSSPWLCYLQECIIWYTSFNSSVQLKYAIPDTFQHWTLQYETASLIKMLHMPYFMHSILVWDDFIYQCKMSFENWAPALAGSLPAAAALQEAIPPDAPSTPVKNPQLGSHTKEETSPLVDSLSVWQTQGKQPEAAEKKPQGDSNAAGEGNSRLQFARSLYDVCIWGVAVLLLKLHCCNKCLRTAYTFHEEQMSTCVIPMDASSILHATTHHSITVLSNGMLWAAQGMQPCNGLLPI